MCFLGLPFLREGENIGKIYWKYVNYKKDSCPGRVYIFEGEASFHSNNHIHDPAIYQIEAKKLVTEMKNRVKTNMEPSLKVISECLKVAPVEVTGSLPSIGTLKSIISTTRSKENCPPIYPGTLTELQIPDLFQVNWKGERLS